MKFLYLLWQTRVYEFVAKANLFEIYNISVEQNTNILQEVVHELRMERSV